MEVANDDSVNSEPPKVSEGGLTHLPLKRAYPSEWCKRSAEGSCGFAIDVCGDRHQGHHTKADANKVRSALIDRFLSGSGRPVTDMRFMKANPPASQLQEFGDNTFQVFDAQAALQEIENLGTTLATLATSAKCLPQKTRS